MQHVLHVNNTGRDTTAYELIIIYIKPNCISSKFQISRANPRSQTYPSIYIMQRWKRERSRGIPSQGHGERFPPPFPPQIHRFGAGKGGGAVRGGAASGLGETRGRRRKKKGGRAGPVDSALPRQCMWRGRPGPTSASRAAASQRGTPAAPLHVAGPKGSPGANNILQGLILKLIKKLKLKNCLKVAPPPPAGRPFGTDVHPLVPSRTTLYPNPLSCSRRPSCAALDPASEFLLA
jgi:hypothetical protein